MRRLRVTILSLVSGLSGWGGPAVAQQVGVMPPAGPVVVRIEVVEPGARQLRPFPEGVAGPAVQMLVGRTLAWRIGERRFEDAAALERALKIISANPKRWVEDPEDPERRVLPPCIVEPAAHCCWNDVVATLDVANEALFDEVRCGGFGEQTVIWRALAVAEPVRDHGISVAPRARWSVPDEEDPDRVRPVLQIGQDGVVRLGDEILLRPREPRAVDRLTPRLLEEAERAAAVHGVVEDESDAPRRLRSDLLLEVDCWAPWTVVQRVVRRANAVDPRFWRIEYAVGDYDFEARMRNGERF